MQPFMPPLLPLQLLCTSVPFTITITIKAPACEDDEWQPIVLPCPVFGVWVAGPALPSGCSAPDVVVMMMEFDVDLYLAAILVVDCVPVTHRRRLVLSHVGLRYVEPGDHYLHLG